jgi:hypothetical protein
MHNYSFNDNDDDIFDEEKTLTNAKPREEKAFKESVNNKSSESDKELKDLLDSLSTDDDDEKPFSFISTLALNFYEASAKWVQSRHDDQFKKALHSYFESLNKGNQKSFPFYEKYYTAQSELAMRRVVNAFLSEIVNSPEKVEQLISKIGSSVDPNFVTTYFSSYFNINQFSILECFSHYKALAQYLDLPFDDSIMKEVTGGSLSPIDYQTFASNQFSLAIIDNQELKTILTEVLSESINRFVKMDNSEDVDI